MIPLSWPDGPQAYYVRGHVSDAEAISDVRAELESERDEDDPPVPELGDVEQTYARWGFDIDEHGERRSRRFEPFVARKQGAFPVTVVRDVAEVRRREAWQQHERETPERSVRLFSERFPEATEVRWVPTGDGTVRSFGRVEGRLPVGVHPVMWTEQHPGFVGVHPDDAAAMREWVVGRKA